MKNLILFFLTSLFVTSCNYSQKSSISVNEGKKVYNVKQTINGIEYVLSNIMEYKNFEFPAREGFHLENKISLQGDGLFIEKKITKSDFERKVDFKTIEKFEIKYILLSVNPSKDIVNLDYIINVGNETETITFTLNKEGGTWEIK